MPNTAEPAAANWRLGRTFESSAGTVAWDRLGDPQAPPLGDTPFSSYVWHQIARALAQRHLVHVWDMPGYGRSDKSPGTDLSLPTLSGVFTELLDHWALPEPAVVAHDTGGGLALDARVRRGDEAHTERIKGDYRAITEPVQLFWGSEDDWIPVERARELLRPIPGSRLRMLPGAGHLSPLDCCRSCGDGTAGTLMA